MNAYLIFPPTEQTVETARCEMSERQASLGCTLSVYGCVRVLSFLLVPSDIGVDIGGSANVPAHGQELIRVQQSAWRSCARDCWQHCPGSAYFSIIHLHYEQHVPLKDNFCFISSPGLPGVRSSSFHGHDSIPDADPMQ